MSISSNFLTNTSLYRNPNGPEQEWLKQEWTKLPSNRKFANPLNVATAELGYIAIIPIAIVETAFMAIAKLFSLFLCLTPETKLAINERLMSSAFAIVWAIGNAFINPFCNDMIATEKVARACAASGNIFRMPKGAL